LLLTQTIELDKEKSLIFELNLRGINQKKPRKQVCETSFEVTITIVFIQQSDQMSQSGRLLIFLQLIF
jgi:hypothetical protein